MILRPIAQVLKIQVIVSWFMLIKWKGNLMEMNFIIAINAQYVATIDDVNVAEYRSQTYPWILYKDITSL